MAVEAPNGTFVTGNTKEPSKSRATFENKRMPFGGGDDGMGNLRGSLEREVTTDLIERAQTLSRQRRQQQRDQTRREEPRNGHG